MCHGIGSRLGICRSVSTSAVSLICVLPVTFTQTNGYLQLFGAIHTGKYDRPQILAETRKLPVQIE
ncbi:hypothetical protein AYY17_17980 [Morganella psychrotolerans]|uniref:Uncharacterized protein n=1 Tax=Morganella psychrotolerans TaxID=368603 RepID=A0A1B8HKL5_9GAMM|nr:hypothetical protein AYY17_17980 [Morganella psychrotolerans]